MRTDIYEHFHPDERDFVDKAWEWVERAGQYHEMKLTDFLDPRQAYILDTLANRRGDVQVRMEGGSVNAERQRALIAPDYAYLDDEDMGLAVLSITSADQKFLQLDHGDYMGALLSLGLKRGKLGDIHVLDDGCHTVVAMEIADYFSLHLHQVHRMNVFTDILPIDQLRTSDVALQMMDLTVASLRLDGIASDVYRLSRSKILTPIKAGRCKVNWKVAEDPSKILQAGDVVSVQGLGRFKVMETDGMTKKGRFRVKVGKFV
ncbi:RNA-binding protein [Paenibacillus sp. TCA20]|uniref:YlmH/Sll1252 family protein n=1 Tax=Paenibacillus urinalis TaxID=521520 RepID=A0AAX3MXH5_9BACL|nr:MULTISPECIES: YlmH/Sll1252 family protein [Paenibacillus]WDH81514.1 YlmH/Sll1252 family protein [Paenibacillus urinalis]GAK39710.1 RNA-binding protein [Paenibacillus sp. TCA20]